MRTKDTRVRLRHLSVSHLVFVAFYPRFLGFSSWGRWLGPTETGVPQRQVCLTWSDHDLVLLGANAEEGEVVLGVDVPHGASGLHHQLVDQAGVLHRAGVVQSRLDGDS